MSRGDGVWRWWGGRRGAALCTALSVSLQQGRNVRGIVMIRRGWNYTEDARPRFRNAWSTYTLRTITVPYPLCPTSVVSATPQPLPPASQPLEALQKVRVHRLESRRPRSEQEAPSEVYSGGTLNRTISSSIRTRFLSLFSLLFSTSKQKAHNSLST